jgi:Stealth protein CR2, conserved region 2
MRATLPYKMSSLTNDDLHTVDAVLLWVDGRDEAWRAKKTLHLSEAPSEQRIDCNTERYEDADELRYALRSLATHAPWLRHVWVVVDSQRPWWWQDNDWATLVPHEAIMPPDALPVFNSSALELNLHRIPGLSEVFLYANDDMLLTQPLALETLMTPDLRIRSYYCDPLPLCGEGAFYALCRNAYELCTEAWPGVKFHLPHHHVCLHRRMHYERAWAMWPDRLAPASRTRFRSPIDLNQYLFDLIGQALGTVVTLPDRELPSKYVRAEHVIDLSDAELDAILADKHMVCFACATEHPDQFQRWAKNKFPTPSPAEDPALQSISRHDHLAPLPDDFDAAEYANLNFDLDWMSECLARIHYRRYGRAEGRQYSAPPLPDDFNVAEYKLMNPDLIGMSDLAASKHYRGHGAFEGRAYRVPTADAAADIGGDAEGRM